MKSFLLVAAFVLISVISVSADNFDDWPVPPKSVNYRKEYDQLFYAFVEDHIYRAERQMILLQGIYDRYLVHKNADELDFLLQEVSDEVRILKRTHTQATTYASNAKEFNELEKYLAEKMVDDIGLLIKHFQVLQNNLLKDQNVSTTTTKKPASVASVL